MSEPRQGQQVDPARRRLLHWFLGTSISALAVAVAWPVLQFLRVPKRAERAANQVEVGPVDDPDLIAKGYKIVRFGGDPVIVVRLGRRDVRAFSAVCTHLGCIVSYQQDNERIFCNCHNGFFDLKGRVVSGPPPEPLPEYHVALTTGGEGETPTIVVSRKTT